MLNEIKFNNSQPYYFYIVLFPTQGLWTNKINNKKIDINNIKN